MAFWSSSPHLPLLLLGLLSLLLFNPTVTGIRFVVSTIQLPSEENLPAFREAPAFRNSDSCALQQDPKNYVHIVMTLDLNYIRGTMAAVLSMLQHTKCPENLSFHFLCLHYQPKIFSTIKSTFPYLNFNVYYFDSTRVQGKISKSIREALDEPLNYARIYLSEILPQDVKRVIYLDSDIIVVDDIAKLYEVEMEDKVVAAPEYCHANFTYYFTDDFWADPNLSGTFKGKKPCYFNTGVMVVDVDRWRTGRYTDKVEEWMIIQKQRRIYHLGSLPPVLLVLAGDIKSVDHRWNQHGLGGDNYKGKCRALHPGPISLLHWSGKGKPWLRLDSGRPCTIDHLWAPYDLSRSSRVALEE